MIISVGGVKYLFLQFNKCLLNFIRLKDKQIKLQIDVASPKQSIFTYIPSSKYIA